MRISDWSSDVCSSDLAGLYNQDGQFQRDIQRLWAECSDIILRISEESWRWEFESADRMNITAQYRDIWLEKALEATRMKYQQGVDRDWVSHIARPARYFFQFGIPSPAIARMHVDVSSKIGLSLRKQFEGDAEKQAILLCSLDRKSVV